MIKLSTRNLAAMVTVMAALLAISITPNARAGGGINEAHEHNDEDGPTYFGFVRDARNTAISDTKVTLKITGGLTSVTRTDRAGLYRVPGLGKQIKPTDVAISCAKEGYEQLRVVRRPPARGKAVKSVETECRMQRR